MRISWISFGLGVLLLLLPEPASAGTEVKQKSDSARPKIKVKLLRKDKDGLWKFRLTNVSSEVVTLSWPFPYGTREPFWPNEVRYEFRSHGTWKECQYSDDMIRYPYPIRPGQRKVFEISMELFDSVPKGSVVRISVNGFYSAPIRWP